MQSSISGKNTVWRLGVTGWVVVAMLAGFIGYLYLDALIELERLWAGKKEYSHGYLIPVISLFLVWQNKDVIQRTELKGSSFGVLIAVLALAVFFMGSLSTIYLVVHYSLVLLLVAVVLAYGGWRGMRLLWVPLVYLAFMIPLPPFLYHQLSTKLQLISSELGVAVIRWFDISVYLEGNVIDLGKFQLQVVEACSGLRYLFPLMSFGFLCAYLFKAAIWQRAIIFLSTIPITVLMNSFRIGVIGVLVEYFGIEQAEGFLHDFEGWIIFMACVSLLFLEMWLMTRIWGNGKALMDVFGIEFPAEPPADAEIQTRGIPAPLIGIGVLVLIAIGANAFLDKREEVFPERAMFYDFPDKVTEWTGERDTLSNAILRGLKVTDYALVNYRNEEGENIGFYSAYYESQKAGAAAHSPRACIPGGGWEIESFTEVMLEGLGKDKQSLKVNRLLIQMGEHKQLVYYWFKQRDRIITSEYLVKWYMFVDALVKNRTDGALMRLTTYVAPGEDIAQADDRLRRFASDTIDLYTPYVPD